MGSIPPNGRSYECDLDAVQKHVPVCLRERATWVCWRYVERGGKPTKCPVDPFNNSLASSTDPKTWGTFDQALVACHRDASLAGVGFVFTPDDPFCGVDLDDCIDPASGAIKSWGENIIEQIDSYAEVSPSALGVKIFIKAHKPGERCRKAFEDGEVEIYDHARFFVMTGRRIETVSGEVETRQAELNQLYSDVFGPVKLPSAATKVQPGLGTLSPEVPSGNDRLQRDDDEILRFAMQNRLTGFKFIALWEGRWIDHFGSQSEADSSVVFTLAFYTKHSSQIDRLFRRSALMREKWDEIRGAQTYGELTIANALTKVTAQYQYGKNSKVSAVAASNGDSANNDHRPTVLIDTEEHRVVTQAVAALCSDPDVFQRGGLLVRVLRNCQPKDGILRSKGAATIGILPAANLRERLTMCAVFTKSNSRGEKVVAHPTPWLVSALEARAEWEGIRHLLGISDCPILRPDGSIWQQSEYDEHTGVLYEPAAGVLFPPIDDDVDIADAVVAKNTLLEVVIDFPFESEEHKAAWLASLLTPLARFAFDGPSPLFLFDSNVRGSGKGLLAQTIGHIVLGGEIPVSSYSHDSEELRKKLTSIAIAGDRMILFDNLDGMFGNDALDRALTSTRWKDRLLGKNEQIELPLMPAWYATGNNVQVAADTMRRIIHIRLDCLAEKPEERCGFKHEKLLAWVDANRGTLLTAALTILSAYLRKGTPAKVLKAFGSYEGWSSVVREAVVWVGLPDPCLTRTRLAEYADTSADTFEQLMAAWRQYDVYNNGIVVSAMLASLYTNREYASTAPGGEAMKCALENLVGCPPGKAPSARQVGNKLRAFRRRVFQGEFLDADSGRSARGVIWRLHSEGGSAECM